MQTVTLKAFIHNNQECIGIHFTGTKELNTAIRKLPGIKWSQTHKCWWLQLNKGNAAAITKAVDSIAIINSSNLKTYLEKKKLVTGTLPKLTNTSTLSKSLLDTMPTHHPADGILMNLFKNRQNLFKILGKT